jgi:hypothetical protein
MMVARGIHELPSVQFDGRISFLRLTDSPTLHWGSSDYSVFVVAEFSTTLGTVNQMLFEKSAVDEPWAGAQLFVNSVKPVLAATFTSQVSEFAFATSTSRHLNDAPHLFAGRRVGELLEARVDGVAEAGTRVSPIVDISDLGQDVIIGQNGNGRPGFQALQGRIAEVVAVWGPISDADLRSLECHLLAKYGISPSSI